MVVILESKELKPDHAQGFEHVKGYAGLAAGKLRVAADLFCCACQMKILQNLGVDGQLSLFDVCWLYHICPSGTQCFNIVGRLGRLYCKFR